MTSNKPTLAITTRIERSHGYEVTVCHVWEVRVWSIADDIAQCESAGEEAPSDAIARTQRAARMRRYLERGYTHCVSSALSESRLNLTVRFQRYDANSFCSPEWNVGSEPGAIAEGARVLARLERRKAGLPETPDALLAAFPSAVKVELEGWDYLVTPDRA